MTKINKISEKERPDGIEMVLYGILNFFRRMSWEAKYAKPFYIVVIVTTDACGFVPSGDNCIGINRTDTRVFSIHPMKGDGFKKFNRSESIKVALEHVSKKYQLNILGYYFLPANYHPVNAESIINVNIGSTSAQEYGKHTTT